MDRARIELIDASAWIEYFRASESPADLALTHGIREGHELATSDPIVMELWAGARPGEADLIRRALAACRPVPVRVEDWHDAAAMFRRCRSAGVTLRGLLDCLVAAVAIRADLPVLAQDRDFDQIARVVPLRLVAV